MKTQHSIYRVLTLALTQSLALAQDTGAASPHQPIAGPSRGCVENMELHA